MKIEARVKLNGEYKCVDILKRNIIEGIYRTINTKDIVIETIKNAYRWYGKNGRYYANLDLALGEIKYTNSIYDTEVLIPLLSIYLNIEDENNLTLDEIYYNSMDTAEFYIGVFNEKLDRIYSQDFRKCELCGGIEDNIKINENYFNEDIDRYECRVISKEYECRDCKNRREVLHI